VMASTNTTGNSIAAVDSGSAKKDEIQNEYIQLVNKKIRALNKKMQKIKEIEDKHKGGSSLNEEQKKTLANKENTEKQLEDYNGMRQQYTKIHTQDEKLRTKQKKKEGEKLSERAAEQIGAVIKLLSFASFLENPDSRKKHLVEQEEASRAGKKTHLTSESELNAVSHLASSILKRGLDKATVDHAVEAAAKYASRSEKDVAAGVSYKRIHEQVVDYFSSKWAPAEAPKPVETPVHKHEEVPAPAVASVGQEAAPSSPAAVSPAPSSSNTTPAPVAAAPIASPADSPSQHAHSEEGGEEGEGDGSQDGFTTQGRDKEGRKRRKKRRWI